MVDHGMKSELETHARIELDGSRRAFRQAGAPLNDPRWAVVLDLIEPAMWTTNKTEAINPATEFWWVDDNPTEYDLDWLHAHDRHDRLIEASSDRDPDALLSARFRLPPYTQ